MNDEEIEELIQMPKRCAEREFRLKPKSSHHELDLELRGYENRRFILFLRIHQELPDRFTCGLRWVPQQGAPVNLLRMNGAHGPHQNLLDRTWLPPVCHIHRATARYMAAGIQAEGFAETTDLFTDIRGAYASLAVVARIADLPVFPAEQLGLFAT